MMDRMATSIRSESKKSGNYRDDIHTHTLSRSEEGVKFSLVYIQMVYLSHLGAVDVRATSILIGCQRLNTSTKP